MYPLSAAEQAKLDTCSRLLQQVVLEVIKTWNICIIEGHRGEAAQNKAYAEGKTQLKYPKGNHNSLPSKAIDMCPVEIKNGKETIDWNDRARLHLFAGFVLGVAYTKGIKMRWGGDWDQDTEVKDNSFDDLVHFEVLS